MIDPCPAQEAQLSAIIAEQSGLLDVDVIREFPEVRALDLGPLLVLRYVEIERDEALLGRETLRAAQHARQSGYGVVDSRRRGAEAGLDLEDRQRIVLRQQANEDFLLRDGVRGRTRAAQQGNGQGNGVEHASHDSSSGPKIRGSVPRHVTRTATDRPG